MGFIVAEGLQFLDQFAKRKTQVISALGMLMLWYLAAFSSPVHNLDYGTYQYQYTIMPIEPPSAWHFEKGYSYLGILFSKMGFSYQTYRSFLCLVAIIALYIGVRRFTQNVSLFAGIYGATVFLLDATQLRNFVMISIVVLAISFLQEVTPKNVIVSVLLILISAQFHSLGYLFLLAVILRMLPFSFLYKYAMGFVGFSIGLILLINIVGVRNILKLAGTILAVVSSRGNLASKVSHQYGDGSVLIRYVAVAVSTLAAFLLIWLLYKVVAMSATPVLQNQFQLLYSVILMAVITLPTLSLADDYSRIPRSIFLFVIIAVAAYYEHSTEIQLTKMRSLVTVLVIIVCAMNGFSHLYMWGTAFRGSLLYLLQLA
ncbi:EpsG family protein [Lacticaseibacillus jixianensis]|uniref:EpsG family protein n=1 Tax=Lacticaseibacillus jixianensis TaxID=2486012 RepID=A0ABW4BCV3_9LACO|nr:EpsG family protein [Lacticaseibacillus jixianensis]